MAEVAKLRRTVFQRFRCFPSWLQRIIARTLGCKVRFQKILGCGSFNLVIEALLLDHQEDEQPRRVAIRIGLPGELRVPLPLAISGYAATLFLARLDLPAVVAGPVYVARPPLPYLPRGGSHFAVMGVAEGVPAYNVWSKDATLAWKKAVLADLAMVTLQLYRHPLDSLGSMEVSSSDGSPCVGRMLQGAVSLAMERGIEVGELSPGPYSSWTEYARNQIEGFVLLYGDDPKHGKSIRANAKLVLDWLVNKFQDPVENDNKFQDLRKSDNKFQALGKNDIKFQDLGKNDNKFYLVHPEFGLPQVLLDPDSGHVTSILDWDGAKTATIHSLAAGFYMPDYYWYDDPDEDEMCEFFKQQLIQGGAPELAEHLTTQESPQLIFEQQRLGNNVGGVDKVQAALRSFCTRLQGLGMIDPAEQVVCSIIQPWSKSSRSSSSASSAASSGSSSSREEAKAQEEDSGSSTESSEDASSSSEGEEGTSSEEEKEGGECVA
ncbi:hypothetical protein SELMODRAFT_419177 [Selaginella moellendorffii]|uniref:Aminoglycoside phosphotransferase domain-containing protein n=1 Tax=Selaginella moellendorffii TaxID=88036 RepID=D8S836_SELML|nr:hypothetical protein SELMODRAFT_419177 [Selaginella moellendorffii]